MFTTTIVSMIILISTVILSCGCLIQTGYLCVSEMKLLLPSIALFITIPILIYAGLISALIVSDQAVLVT